MMVGTLRAALLGGAAFGLIVLGYAATDQWSEAYAGVGGPGPGPASYTDAKAAAAAPVQSVFSRTGAVVAASGDYTFAQISSTPTTFAGYGLVETSAGLRGVLSDESGSGAAIFAGSPTFTGTAAFASLTASGTLVVTGEVDGASFVPTSATVPTNGMYLCATNALCFATNSTVRWSITGSNLIGGVGGGSGAMRNVVASATVPTFVPNSNSTTTGLGANASGVVDMIVAGVDTTRWDAQGVRHLGTIPTVSGTGTPTITTGSTDTAGEVTGGNLATSIVITFAASKTNAPFCVVTPQTQVAAFAYTVSTTAITITLTATTGEVVDYHCFQH